MGEADDRPGVGIGVELQLVPHLPAFTGDGVIHDDLGVRVLNAASLGDTTADLFRGQEPESINTEGESTHLRPTRLG